MKALIIEPSKAVAMMLATLFSKYGIESHTAVNGQEGLFLLKHRTVDLLCFAFELSDMDGVGFLSTAMSRKLLHSQPCLMLTSHQASDVISDALKAGVTECFFKHRLDDLEQFVSTFVEGNQRRIDGRVLLVEDSSTSALFCRNVLEQMGLQVEHCLSAEHAIMLWGNQHYDLVLVDYVLKGPLSGLSVIRTVRGSPGRIALTPILVLSSFGDTARKVEILRTGTNDFVAKPVVAEELEARVFNLIRMHQLMRRLDQQHETMKGIAMRDHLTSLYNRSYLNEVISSLIDQARESGTPLSLIVVDLDDFKLINDTDGHKAGDQVLQNVAASLEKCCRSTDLVARIGGDEFVMVLPRVALADAVIRGERIRSRLAGLKTESRNVTTSIGVAELLPGEEYDALFHRADDALYRAKAKGRNNVAAAQGSSALSG